MFARADTGSTWRPRLSVADGAIRDICGDQFEGAKLLPQTADDPDADIVARIARGDPAAVQALMARRLPRLLSLARRMLADPAEAEDVTQEVFLRAWKQAPRWKPGAGRFDTWLHRVALNLCYDRLRRRRETVMAEPPDIADPAPDAEAGLVQTDVAGQVEAAVASLPPRQREALILAHYQEFSNPEAAELMNISVEALESLLSRARRTLRARLGELAGRRGGTDGRP